MANKMQQSIILRCCENDLNSTLWCCVKNFWRFWENFFPIEFDSSCLPLSLIIPCNRLWLRVSQFYYMTKKYAFESFSHIERNYISSDKHLEVSTKIEMPLGKYNLLSDFIEWTQSMCFCWYDWLSSILFLAPKIFLLSFASKVLITIWIEQLINSLIVDNFIAIHCFAK